MDSHILSPDLGTLSLLPRELRDRIYSLTLNLNIPRHHSEGRAPWSDEYEREEPAPYRTGILIASKRIHEEAKIAFFQTNEFCFWVDHDCEDNRRNKSVMGQIGFVLKVGHNDIYRSRGSDAFLTEIPYDMIPHMQHIHFTVGGAKGVSEIDIVGPEHQTVFGPERPTYVPLLNVIHDVCALLKSCHQIHMLRISIRSIEHDPGSVEQVLDPIRKLRRIKESQTVVWSMQVDRWVDWNLKGSYGRYLNQILSLPEGAEAPKYVGDEKEPDQSEDNIFDIIGAVWMGGTTFAYPGDDDDDSDDYNEQDFYDDYDDLDGDFDYDNGSDDEAGYFDLD